MPEFLRQETFCPRAIRAAGIVSHDDWRLKRYDITLDASPVSESDYSGGVALALSVLPRPAASANRPGVGFLIRHSGRTVQYVVLAWWDNQNELLNRVYVRDLAAGTPWREAAGGYSFCVWDLEVLWHERCAFVRHVLSPTESPNLPAYLGDMMAAISSAIPPTRA